MAFEKVNKILLKVFGSRNERLVKGYMMVARRAAAYEEQLQQLDDEALKAKTTEFRARLVTWSSRESIASDIMGNAGYIAAALVLAPVRRSLGKGDLPRALKDFMTLSPAGGRLHSSLVIMQQASAVMSVLGELLRSRPETPYIETLIRGRAQDLADYLRTTDVAACLIRYRKEIASLLVERALPTTPKEWARLPKNMANMLSRRRQGAIDKCRKELKDISTPTKDQVGAFIERQARGLAHVLTDDEAHLILDPAASAVGEGESLEVEVFAVVREVARRTVNMRHFDVQLAGGKVLSEGKIAEMATGEGKTLVATLAAYLLYLKGRKVHVVTVNDYLAKRDAEWMAPIYNALGMTVGAIQADMDTAGDERKSQYACDVVYGTNNEFGFDYLRDNMKTSLEQMVQGPLEYAIIDEVDSILIDEARTPLIISGPAFDDVSRYKQGDQVARKLISLQSNYDRIKRQIDSAQRAIAGAQGELAEAKKEKDDERIEKAHKAIEQAEKEFGSAQERLSGATQYYEAEQDKKAVHLTHEGIGAAQEITGVGSFFTGSNMGWPHLLEQSLRAHVTFEREKDYVVMEGKVVIVDEFTGRLMDGRQWSDGLHQAVEAKEAVTIKKESQTLATITLQNFFKLYDQIAGMTGTAATEAEEFMNIYELEVVVIPTNEPCIRDDREDLIYQSMREKFDAIVEEINEISSAGRPVLVGTVSIEKNEALSNALKQRYGKEYEHEILNAKHHKREAAIVAKAGQQHKSRDDRMLGNVTIATNMAGRGTDIKLGPGVAEIGGLHVLGTERYEARRIDNQLRGRCGRQGDAGSSQYFMSFDDDLLKVFAPDWTVKALSWIGWEEGQPIIHSRISKGIEKAQKKVEERNFEVRKSLLEYDEVMDYQRKTFYSRRREILRGKMVRQIIEEMYQSAITKQCKKVLSTRYALDTIVEWAKTEFDVELKLSEVADASAQEIEAVIKERARDNAANNISLSLGEYLEDYSDPGKWNIAGLCGWAKSVFDVDLSPIEIKDNSPDEIKEKLIEAAGKQIADKDYSQLAGFLRKDFAVYRLAEWVRVKLDALLDIERIRGLNAEEVREMLIREYERKYKEREIAYPVEVALSWISDPEVRNVYGFESLAHWANEKYRAGLSASQFEKMGEVQLREQLLALSRAYDKERLEGEVRDAVGKLNPTGLAEWARERFAWAREAKLERLFGFGREERFEEILWADQLGDLDESVRLLMEAGRSFLRSELTNLERDVLRFVHDSAWKDHLYAMDQLRNSIWMRSLAEKDPKTEYKREAVRLFEQMFERIEEHVTDVILKVERPKKAEEAKDLYTIAETSHERVSQFADSQYNRARYEQSKQLVAAQYEQGAQAPQGEQRVKQIKLEQPKVGRNDPCPCGSGKKYKKCCGKNL